MAVFQIKWEQIAHKMLLTLPRLSSCLYREKVVLITEILILEEHCSARTGNNLVLYILKFLSLAIYFFSFLKRQQCTTLCLRSSFSPEINTKLVEAELFNCCCMEKQMGQQSLSSCSSGWTPKKQSTRGEASTLSCSGAGSQHGRGVHF